MNIIDINNIYKHELTTAVLTNKITFYKTLYMDKLSELILLLKLINNDLMMCYLFLCNFLYLQINLYEKYWLLIRMAPLLKFH